MTRRRNTEEPTTLGAYLKRLRTEKNISVVEMAAKMYLHPQTIEALERDDYENLPGRLYVYGYLQHYAKILDVPVDEVLAMYGKDTAEAPEQRVAKAPVRWKPKLEFQSKKWTYALIYLVPFILVLAALALWRGKYAQEPHEITGSTGEPATIVEHRDTPGGRAPGAETGESEQDTEAADIPQQVTAQEPETTPQAAQEAQAGQAREPESPAAATQGDPGTVPFHEEETITAGIGPDMVTLVLSIDCWIEIFDAGNEKVFYDLARAGQTLVLSGTAPFSVLLGNADAATVEFNSAPFDITPHVTGIGIARFVLGADQ